MGRTLTNELISEIQTRLLSADVGTRTTTRLIDGIRADFLAGKMTLAATKSSTSSRPK